MELRHHITDDFVLTSPFALSGDQVTELLRTYRSCERACAAVDVSISAVANAVAHLEFIFADEDGRNVRRGSPNAGNIHDNGGVLPAIRMMTNMMIEVSAIHFYYFDRW